MSDAQAQRAIKLHDAVIARIAQALQESILTGTDVVDTLRSIELKIDGLEVKLADGYVETVKKNHDKMLSELAALLAAGAAKQNA